MHACMYVCMCVCERHVLMKCFHWQRGYVLRQNPVVKVFPSASNGNTFGLQLAINTNQFGRTFQDR